MNSVDWPNEAVDKFWTVCKASFDLRTAKLLEQRLRKGTGTEHLLEVGSSCCSKNGNEHTHHDDDNELAPYCFNKAPYDQIGEALCRFTRRFCFVDSIMVPVAERAATVYNKTVQSVDTPLSRQQRAEIQKCCIGSAISSCLEQHIIKEKHRAEQFNVRDGGLVAHPTGYLTSSQEVPFPELDSIPLDKFAELKNQGWTTVESWLPQDKLDQFKLDYEWLEMNSIFDDQTTISPNPHRNEQAVWIRGIEITKEHKILAIMYLLQKMSSLPFEINKKTSPLLTLSNDAFFAVYNQGMFFKEHRDNVPGEYDNGRVYTFLFCVDPAANEIDPEPVGTEIRVTDEETNKTWTITPNSNSVLAFESRRFKYSIEPATKKTYLVYYWCSGVSPGGRKTA